ncbi:hypothetical protein B0H19DRAFT_91423 [Mycena capillaripes]|nr:hypothetical protein B0H19DRAFT_91423 [Mycena capillaripes]
MPLFKSHPYPEGPEPVPEPAEPPRPTGGFFSSLSRRNQSASDLADSDYRSARTHPDADAASVRSGFFFGRRRSTESLASSSSKSTTQTGHSRSTSASHKSRSTAPTSPASDARSVKSAAGGTSLLASSLKRYTARARAREALESVKVLEGEAEEGANRAKAKNALARLVSKDARGLGRHG